MLEIAVNFPVSGKPTVAREGIVEGRRLSWKINSSNSAIKKVRIRFEGNEKFFATASGTKNEVDATLLNNGTETVIWGRAPSVDADTTCKYTIVGLDRLEKKANEIPTTKLDPEIIVIKP